MSCCGGMKPEQYQHLAMRTRCGMEGVSDRLANMPDMPAEKSEQLLHSIIGLTGEVGELSSAIEKYAFYKQDFDAINIQEEISDCLWYLAEACDALDVNMGDLMEANINKLRNRYPEKFEEELAKEESRDRESEADVYKFISQRDMRRAIAEDSGVFHSEESDDA